MNLIEKQTIQAHIDFLRAAERVGRGLEPSDIRHPRLFRKRRMAKITTDLKHSGETMRFVQAEIKNSIPLMDLLPNPFDQLLSAAAAEMISCCSLASYSMKRCDTASEFLDEAKELLSAIG